jgi:hypothetical protein
MAGINGRSAPIALSDEQMSAILAASYPLPPSTRSAFLETCAREIAALTCPKSATARCID